MTTPLPPYPNRCIRWRYPLEFGVSVLAYVGVMWFRNWMLLDGPLRNAAVRYWPAVAVALLPIFPLGLMLVAIIRCFRSMDEMMRRIQSESLAIAAGVTAMLSATYGLIESPSFHYLSAWWTYTCIMGTWLISSFFVSRRYR